MVDSRITRRRLVRRGLSAAGLLVAAGWPGSGWGAEKLVRGFSVRNAARPFRGDRSGFATISPRSGARRGGQAVVDVVCEREPVDATLEVVSRNGVGVRVVSRDAGGARSAGRNAIPWAPEARSIEAGLVRPAAPATGRDSGSRCSRLGGRARARRRGDVPASAARVPGENAIQSSVQSDAPWLDVDAAAVRAPKRGRRTATTRCEASRSATPQRIDLRRQTRPADTRPGHDRTSHGERPLRRPARRSVRPRRVRAARRCGPAAPSSAGRDRSADDDVAGLQLLRPERRRLRRHLVLAVGAEADRPDPPPPAPRCARALTEATKSSSSTGSPPADTQSTRTPTRTSICSLTPRRSALHTT